MAMVVIVSGPVPVFFSVEVCAGLVVPTACDVKVRLVGVKVTAGVAAAPVPVRATVCGDPGASSVTARFAVRVPVVVGAKETEIVQLAEAASVDGLSGQVFVCA
jgi:hypothetical protein